MSESPLISRRRQEVQDEVSRLENDVARAQEKIAKARQELADLETAERVLARLSGAEWPAPSEEDKQQPESASDKKPKGLPTMPEMIEAVLKAAHTSGRNGLTPREAKDMIASRFWSEVKTQNVNAIMWRMEQRGQLEKGDDAEYRLPDTKSAPDDDLLGNTSGAGVSSNPARDREAGQGGGT